MDYKIADKLIALRKRSGFSQEELADKLSVSRQAISKWERAESLPDTENLIGLSKLYSVSLDELVCIEAGVSEEKTQVEKDDKTVEEPAPCDSSSSIAITLKSCKSFLARNVFLITSLVGFIVMIICLPMVGYYIGELIEIHQPGYVFEPGDTLRGERAGYITSLVISSLFAIAGLVLGIVCLIKHRKKRRAS